MDLEGLKYVKAIESDFCWQYSSFSRFSQKKKKKKKIGYSTKSNKTENKITDHNHDKYTKTGEFK